MDAVYNSHPWKQGFGLNLQVGGPRKITLGFAERYLPACGKGKTVFSATVGTKTEAGIDVFDRAGGCHKAYDVVFDNAMPDVDGVIPSHLIQHRPKCNDITCQN